MKKSIAIVLTVILLCGCAVYDDESAAPSEQAQETIAEVETPVPDPTPLPELTRIDLAVETPINTRVLNETQEPGVYSVQIPEEENTLPTAPTYLWYINGAEADTIDEVVIEFDVFDTIRPLDGLNYGYDQAFYIVLHNFDKIPSLPPWPVDYISFRRDDIDRNIMLQTPEFGVDLKKHATWEGEHVRIAIPYSEFQNASKDLTLQFLPGTTFGHLSIYLSGADGLFADTVEKISQRMEYPERDLMAEEIQPLYPPKREPFPMVSNPGIELGNRIRVGSYDVDVMDKAQYLNPDGSVNMPVSFYSLGEYADEVQGKYAVIPEGIVSVLASFSAFGAFTNEEKQQFITFVVENMIDEDGQFYGVYDIEQQKLVAMDRKAAALPILAALSTLRDYESDPGIYKNFVSNRVLDAIANSIIANDIVHVGNSLYYAPYGIDTNGVMDLKLSDFAITASLFTLLTEYSQDGSRLKEEYGCAMLLEGVANSLKLILEGQEQNATRLPSSELRVLFSGDGERYELQPSDTFSINNSYFSIGLMQYAGFYNYIDQFAYYKTGFNESIDHTVMRLAKVKNGAYSQNQVQAIRKMEARFAEMTDAYQICNTLYKSWLDVYNFLKVQPSNLIYADGYNVHTGELVKISGEAVDPFIGDGAKIQERFGTPATSMNYFLLTGIFNDEAMGLESGHLALVNFDMHVTLFSPLSSTNPDTFADNGFNIWGYDTLRYAGGGLMPVHTETYPLFYASGENMNRGNWRDFAMRKINQFTENEDNFLAPGDAFPTFYDHVPVVEITG